LKLKIRDFATICILASFLSPAFAQESAADTYAAKCKMCHGADGTGNTPAGKIAKIVSFKDPSIVKASDDELIAVVKNGKNKMPAFAGKLSDDQINSLVAYIRTLQK
jgi:cytochrome c6